jgi:hypothetical protein
MVFGTWNLARGTSRGLAGLNALGKGLAAVINGGDVDTFISKIKKSMRGKVRTHMSSAKITEQLAAHQAGDLLPLGRKQFKSGF